jgi:hypothetical protein
MHATTASALSPRLVRSDPDWESQPVCPSIRNLVAFKADPAHGRTSTTSIMIIVMMDQGLPPVSKLYSISGSFISSRIHCKIVPVSSFGQSFDSQLVVRHKHLSSSLYAIISSTEIEYPCYTLEFRFIHYSRHLRNTLSHLLSSTTLLRQVLLIRRSGLRLPPGML